MIIDAHTHLDITGKQLGEKTVNAKKLIKSMEEAGIDKSLVIAVDYLDSSTSTETLLGECGIYDQLKVIGSVIFKDDIRIQTEKLTEYIDAKKIVGVKIYPGYEDFYPNDDFLALLYKHCQNKGVPVIFHTGVLIAGAKGKLRQVHPLNIDEVATNFPDLNIIMAHMGNPWIVDCAAVMLKNENVYTDLSGFFPEFELIVQSEIDIFVRKMGEFIDFMGDYKKCLFGTDYPLYSQKEYLDAVGQLKMSDEEKKLVFWKNAEMLFDL